MDKRRAADVDVERGRTLFCSQGWLANTPVVFRDAVLDRCHWWRHDPDDTVMGAGDPTAGLFGIAEGEAAYAASQGPPDSHLTTIIRPGEWFGVGPIFSGAQRSATILTRTSVVIAHLEPTVRRMLADTPEWWRHLGHLALIYAEVAANIAVDLAIPDSTRRCVATLLRLAGRAPDPQADGTAEARVTQDELGAAANLSRHSVNRILTRLQADGLVSVGYRSIRILKVAAAGRVVNGG